MGVGKFNEILVPETGPLLIRLSVFTGLSAGTSYTLTVASLIGTSSPCGGLTPLSSTIDVVFCTGKQIKFVTIGSFFCNKAQT